MRENIKTAVKSKKAAAILLIVASGAAVILTVSNDTAVSRVYLPVVATPYVEPWLGYSWAWWGERSRVDTEMASWYYRHFPMAQAANPYPGLEMVPMVHCDNQLDRWQQNYPAHYNGFVLWLNEPLSWDQCPMSVTKAIAFYNEFRALCPRCKIIGPQMEAKPEARPWFIEFMSHEPDLYGIGVHHYSFIRAWEPSESQLAFYEGYGLPLWVTEFGTDDATAVSGYLEIYTASPLVERVAYFAPYIPEGASEWPSRTRLFDAEGRLTAVGRALWDASEDGRKASPTARNPYP